MKKVLGLVMVGVVLVLAVSVPANVLNMGGTRNADGSWNGLASLQTVPVGNAGNAADTTGYGSVGYNYNIGKYEVTAGQYTEFLNAVAKTDTYELYSTYMWSSVFGCKIQQTGTSGNYSYSVRSDYANRPVNFVSWGDSARFANWLHNNQPTGAQDLSTTEDGAYYLNGATSDQDLLAVNRKTTWKWAVTSEDEWYKAAYYKGGSTNAGYFEYPTSSDTAPSNVLGSPTDPGNNATCYNNGSTVTISGPYWRTEVGEHENSDSPYGTFDQGGNICEWNEAILSGSRRVLRGGGFGEGVSNLQASNRNYYYYPTSEFPNAGFRVSEVPEPASMALLALGGAGILVRRRGLGR